jgi:hypothetical protein
MGRLIRHGRNCVTLAVSALPVSVIEPAFETPLVPAIGISALLATSFPAAGGAAVALAAITMRTDKEHRLASLAPANSLPENYFSMRLHPPTQADFDKGNGSCHGKGSFEGDLLRKVAKPEPRCFRRRGSLRLSSHNTSFCRNVLAMMIDG